MCYMNFLLALKKNETWKLENDQKFACHNDDLKISFQVPINHYVCGVKCRVTLLFSST